MKSTFLKLPIYEFQTLLLWKQCYKIKLAVYGPIFWSEQTNNSFLFRALFSLQRERIENSHFADTSFWKCTLQFIVANIYIKKRQVIENSLSQTSQSRHSPFEWKVCDVLSFRLADVSTYFYTHINQPLTMHRIDWK